MRREINCLAIKERKSRETRERVKSGKVAYTYLPVDKIVDIYSVMELN